jgi:hypothetical protein
MYLSKARKTKWTVEVSGFQVQYAMLCVARLRQPRWRWLSPNHFQLLANRE